MEGVLTGCRQIVFMRHANAWSMKPAQTYLKPVQARWNTLRYVEGWISVDERLGQEVHAKNHSEHICTRSHTFASVYCTHT